MHTHRTVLIISPHTEFYLSVGFLLHNGSTLNLLLLDVFFHVCAAELCLNAEVTELLSECEQPGLVQSLLLPEDLALRHLPALSATHRRLDFTRRNPSLNSLQEVHTSPHTQFSHRRWSVKAKTLNHIHLCTVKTYDFRHSSWHLMFISHYHNSIIWSRTNLFFMRNISLTSKKGIWVHSGVKEILTATVLYFIDLCLIPERKSGLSC